MSLPQLFDLAGKVALVTGAGGGLGREIADALAEAGADVACVDLNSEAAAETAVAVSKHDRRAATITCARRMSPRELVHPGARHSSTTGRRAGCRGMPAAGRRSTPSRRCAAAPGGRVR